MMGLIAILEVLEELQLKKVGEKHKSQIIG